MGHRKGTYSAQVFRPVIGGGEFWPVHPIHTNSLFWVTFEELQFCHFPPPNTSIRGRDSQI